MNACEIMSIMIEHAPGMTPTIQPKMSGFARYIGKSGGILVRAFGEADITHQELILKRFPDVKKVWEMCCNNIKDGFCRVVVGSYMMGLSPEDIEAGCKELGIWKEAGQ